MAKQTVAERAREYINDVKAGKFAAYMSEQARRVRNTLTELSIYRTRDLNAPEIGHAHQVEHAREVLRIAADELDANDLAALADVAAVLISQPNAAEHLRPYYERNAALFARGGAMHNPRTRAAKRAARGGK